MQTVASGWTAEERDVVRRITSNLQVSWKKFSLLGGKTFTIGVSTIGGNDIIGINPGAIGSPGNYRYFDETSFLTGLAWERGLSLPVGGLTKAMAEAELDNTSGRFTPRYVGGNSELFTSILPRRPIIINGGFELGGISQTIPQFSGVLNKQPSIDMRSRTVSLSAVDYVDYFQNKYLDQTVMFTAQRSDQVISTLFQELGMSTAQYDLDYGINIIPFGLFPSGTKFYDALNKIVQAENGHLYQDESGIFRFENRQHWDVAPYNAVQRVIYTAQVIESEVPDDNHIINVVEIKGTPRQKEALQLVYESQGFGGVGDRIILPNSDLEIWITFDDPMLEIVRPVAATAGTSFYVFNTEEDGTGTDSSSSVYVKSFSKFATAAKIVFSSNSSQTLYLSLLQIFGRPARRTGDVYYRSARGLSVTAYEEQTYELENEFIQSQTWAESYGEMILNDFAFPENLQKIKIRAIPELQMGDLVSWQGRYWRIFDIKSVLNPGEGYTQELTLLQRNITAYFRIGISTIGGHDKIAP